MDEIFVSFARCIDDDNIPKEHKDMHFQYCLYGIKDELETLMERCIMESKYFNQE